MTQEQDNILQGWKNYFELLCNPVYILCYVYLRDIAKFKAEAYDIRKNVIYKPNV